MCMSLISYYLHIHILQKKIPATEPQAMDLQERNRLARDLQRTKANDVEYNRIRRALLDGLTRGETTRDGDSQHEKLESVERNIRENLRVMHDLEVILATNHALNQ